MDIRGAITSKNVKNICVGWFAGTKRLLRRDRPDAGPAQGRHRHRHRAPQVRQARQGQVLEINVLSLLHNRRVIILDI